jgi:hypothetical protein
VDGFYRMWVSEMIDLAVDINLDEIRFAHFTSFIDNFDF